jgi:hypothetical protein
VGFFKQHSSSFPCHFLFCMSILSPLCLYVGWNSLSCLNWLVNGQDIFYFYSFYLFLSQELLYLSTSLLPNIFLSLFTLDLLL